MLDSSEYQVKPQFSASSVPAKRFSKMDSYRALEDLVSESIID